MEEPQTLNKYHYAINNPLRYIDPDGHQAMADALKIGVTITVAAPHPAVKAVGVAILVGVGVEATIGWDNVGKAAKGTLDWARSGNTAADSWSPGLSSSERMGQSLMENRNNQKGTEKIADGREGKDFTTADKRKIDARDGGRCQDCGREVEGVQNKKGVSTPENQRQRHHIIPKSAGGRGRPDNAATLCPGCYIERHEKIREIQNRDKWKRSK